MEVHREYTLPNHYHPIGVPISPIVTKVTALAI